MDVSVIIPTYNSEAYLERAFDSVWVQAEDGSVEIILVDNNSTDETVALSERLRNEHPEEVTTLHEQKQGAAAARNRGLEAAQGTWVQFLDSDDVLLPGKLKRQVDLFNDEVDWVIGASKRLNLDGEISITQPNDDPWKGLAHNGGTGDTNANLFRRTKLIEIGGQNNSLQSGEDTDMYFRLLASGARTTIDREPGSIYIDREGYRLSTQNESACMKQSVKLKARTIEYLSNHQPSYFAANAAFFHSALLNDLRMLATYSKADADFLYDNYFPKGIKAAQLEKSILPSWASLYPVVGFKLIEGARLMLKNLLPVTAREWLKNLHV